MVTSRRLSSRWNILVWEPLRTFEGLLWRSCGSPGWSCPLSRGICNWAPPQEIVSQSAQSKSVSKYFQDDAEYSWEMKQARPSWCQVPGHGLVAFAKLSHLGQLAPFQAPRLVSASHQLSNSLLLYPTIDCALDFSSFNIQIHSCRPVQLCRSRSLSATSCLPSRVVVVAI